MVWTDHSLGYYVEINATGNQFDTGLICALRFEPLWETIQCCLTYMGYKGFRPAVFNISYSENTLRRGEIMRNLLYLLNGGTWFGIQLIRYLTIRSGRNKNSAGGMNKNL